MAKRYLKSLLCSAELTLFFMVTRKENNFTKIPQWYDFYIILRIDKLMNSMQKFCQRGVIRMVISGDFAFTRTQKFPVELWRGRYRTNFTGNTNHNNFFRDLCRHSIKTFFNFLSMSILAICCNRWQETVSIPK